VLQEHGPAASGQQQAAGDSYRKGREGQDLRLAASEAGNEAGSAKDPAQELQEQELGRQPGSGLGDPQQVEQAVASVATTGGTYPGRPDGSQRAASGAGELRQSVG
jgi:hypothetical protein